jgi:competence protein ComEA
MMRFYFEERLAVFVILAVAIPGTLLVGYLKYPQIFSVQAGVWGRDSVAVTIVGAVELPGAHRVARGTAARAAAVTATPLTDARLDLLDACMPLVEGEVVYVPSMGESTAEVEEKREAVLRSMRRPLQLRRVDVNTASRDELALVPGIGPKMAESIVLERTRAPFHSLEDLRRVSGIGPKKYERIKDYLTVQ